jgi:hypothetical protein
MNAVVVVPAGAPEDEWLEGRAGGVTASEIHSIAVGSRKTWRRLLDEKLNGSTFRGNEHTRRGHEWEPRILAALDDVRGVRAIQPSSTLFGHEEHRKHRATPDALGVTEAGVEFGVEVKHHQVGHVHNGIPADHYDQMQWGMHVTGFTVWLYGWMVDGEDVQHTWIPADEERITFLVRQADAFIEWRACGAPDLDDIPEDIDEHIAEDARLQQLESQIKKERVPHRAAVTEWASKQTPVDGEPLRVAGTRAQLFFQPKPDVTVLDEADWADKEPESYAEYLQLKQRVKAVEEAAMALYRTTKPVAPTFRVTPNGEKR